MDFLGYLACIVIGLVIGFGLVCFLLVRSHENFRQMFNATPKDK